MPVNHGGGFIGLCFALVLAAVGLAAVVFVLATIAKVWTG